MSKQDFVEEAVNLASEYDLTEQAQVYALLALGQQIGRIADLLQAIVDHQVTIELDPDFGIRAAEAIKQLVEKDGSS